QTCTTVPYSVDICVIGSGLSGAMVVHRLTKQIENMSKSAKKPTILLLDAQNLCEGATARNGGHCKPLNYLGFRADAKRLGAKAVNELYSFESSQIHNYVDLIRSEDIDCDLHVTRAVDVFFDKEAAKEAKMDFDKRKRLFPQSVKNDDVHEIKDKNVLNKMAGTIGGQWGCHYLAGHLWPYKLATALILKSIKRANGNFNVMTNKPVIQIKQKPNISHQIFLESGSFHAQIVIVCTNAWTSGILPQFKDKIVPVKGTVAAINLSKNHQIGSEAHGGEGKMHLTYGLRVDQMDYMIVRQGRGRVPGVGDQSVILGGGRSVYANEVEKWYNNNDDSTLLPNTKSYFSSFMPQFFKNWKEGSPEGQQSGKLQSIWTGILGYSHDLLPYVGRVDQGIYVSAGFTGHGMPRIPACSFAIADMALS
ncbi:FAD dependent oxidoreductase, partial [Meira miltonrushii]